MLEKLRERDFPRVGDRPVRLRALRRAHARRRPRRPAAARRHHRRLRHRDLLGRRDDLARVGAAVRRDRLRRGRQLLAPSAATPRSRSSSPRSTPRRSTPTTGIVANPNCSTMQLMVALKPIYDAAGIERLIVSTYQSVSGTGVKAVKELEDQTHALLHGSQRPPAPRSTRTRSRSTSTAAPATSSTATTTPTRSAR